MQRLFRLLFLFVVCVLGQTQLYISVENGSDMNNCTSSEFSCASLQGALDSIPNSSQTVEILIATGIYGGKNNTGISFPPDITLGMISLSNDSALTIFDCNFNGTGFISNNTILSIDGFTIQNCGTAISSFGTNPLQVTNSKLRNNTNCIFSSSTSIVTLENVSLEGTESGILVRKGSVVVSSCTFSRMSLNTFVGESITLKNSTFTHFGLITLNSESPSQISGCTFSNSVHYRFLTLTGHEKWEISDSLFDCVGINQESVYVGSDTKISRSIFENCVQALTVSGSLEMEDCKISSALVPLSVINAAQVHILNSNISGTIDKTDTTTGISLSVTDSITLENSQFIMTSFQNIKTTAVPITAIVQNCLFSQSFGIAIDGNGAWMISNTIFEDVIPLGNEAKALDIMGPSLELNSCIIRNSSATVSSAIIATTSTVNINNCIFSDNLSPNATGSVLLLSNYQEAQIFSSSFSNNAGLSGTVYLDSPLGNATVSDCTFQGNQIQTSGAGISASTTLLVSRCEFIDNIAINIGGGIYASVFDQLNVTGSTFTGNQAKYGAAVGTEYLISSYSFPSASVDITGSTFTSNQATDGSIFACLGFADSEISFYFDNDNQKSDNVGNEIDCGVKSLNWLITSMFLTIGSISLIILVACVAFFITKKKDSDDYDVID